MSSLATRCTACGTVFRVVQDQLRVSEGWVRCGRCTEVFNAVENLVDPPLTAPSAPAATASAGNSGAMARVGRQAGSESWAERHADRHSSGDDVDLPLEPEPERRPAAEPSELPEWARSDLAETAPLQRADRAGADSGDDLSASGPADVDLDVDGFPAPPPPEQRPDGGNDISADPDDRYGASSLMPSGFEASALPHEAAAVAPGGRHAQPSFIRRADRAARWQQPRVRAGLAAVSVLALLALLAQTAHSYRDLLAARWPATQPLLVQACGVLGCTVQAPRLIDALVVDSSGLLRVERSSVYKLSVTLRNQDQLTVALPALDLTLTDTQGRLVARRVLSTTELGTTQASLAAGAELALQATLQTPAAGAGQAVAGYTIDLFYP
jgi:predicted Zn finger-like uncharacterized protein